MGQLGQTSDSSDFTQRQTQLGITRHDGGNQEEGSGHEGGEGQPLRQM